MKPSIFLPACVALLLGPAVLNAQIVGLSNGDFEANPLTAGATDNVTTPGGWNQSIDNWDTFLSGTGVNGNTATSTSFAFGWGNIGQRGYIYQQIGTYAGESSITLTGDAIGSNNNFGDFDTAFYATSPGSFTAADNVDIAGSGMLIGSVDVLTAPQLEFTHTLAAAELMPLTLGDELWVRIGDGPNSSGNDEPYIDNLRISATAAAAVPEPGAIAAWSIIASMLFVRYRRMPSFKSRA